MAADVDNLVLEHLRHIRRSVDEIKLDIVDLKGRMTALETSVANSQAQSSQMGVQLAGQSGRLDRFDERLGRIERRLELHEPA